MNTAALFLIFIAKMCCYIMSEWQIKTSWLRGDFVAVYNRLQAQCGVTCDVVWYHGILSSPSSEMYKKVFPFMCTLNWERESHAYSEIAAWKTNNTYLVTVFEQTIPKPSHPKTIFFNVLNMKYNIFIFLHFKMLAILLIVWCRHVVLLRD